MDRFERDLLVKVAAVPAGEKLPLSRIARELDCSTSVAISGVAALVMSGKLDKVTVRPAVVAAKAPRDRHAYVDTMCGRALMAEMQPFLDATRMPPTTLTKRALGDPGAWGRWKSGKTVRVTTAERVRAFVAAQSATASDTNLIDETLAGRDPAAGEAAPVPGAGDKAGATVARCNPVASADRLSGQELYDEILRFTASDDGLTLRQFAELMGRSVAGIANIAKAALPNPETVTRAHAIIAGDRTPFVAAHKAPDNDFSVAVPALAERRAQLDAAAARRLPGETIADAVKREAEDSSVRRMRAFKPHPDAVPDGIALTPHHPHARRFPGLAPDVWERVRSLAAETGEQPAALLGPLIERGIDAMQAEAGR